MAVEDGIGALQFSVGLYVEGQTPDISQKTLEHLLYHFEDAQGFERHQNALTWQSNFVFGITCDYVDQEGFVRVWHCSNGADITMITFVVDSLTTPEAVIELDQADHIVKSLKFKDRADTKPLPI
ncbi:MAG: hypothetical protein V4599_03875 [Verrucomicrobiota bacterium]